MGNMLFEVAPLVNGVPLNPPIRLAAANADATGTQLDGKVWLPFIVQQPTREVTLSSDGVLDTIQVAHGSITFWMSPEAENEDWSGYEWTGASARAYVGNLGDPFTSYTQIFEGKTSSLKREGINATLELLGPEGDLDTNLLTVEYQGTGGIEGNASLSGKLKPRAFGSPQSVIPVLLDQANQIYQVDGYGTPLLITAIYDMALQLDPARNKGDFASYNALKNADVQPGEWATCNAQGLFRLGALTNTKVSADLTVTGGTIATIVPQLLAAAGVPSARIGNFSAWTQSFSLYVTEQAKIGDLVRDAMKQAGGYIVASGTGVWQPGDYFASKSATPIATDGGLPFAYDVSEPYVYPPVYKVRVGYDRCWGVHSESEVSPALAIIADDVEAATQAALAAQETADEAAADAVYARQRVENQAKDNVLDRSEKAQVIRDFSSYIVEKPIYVAAATALGVDTSDYSLKFTALSVYLNSLSPAYTDQTQDTFIAGSTYQAKFADYLTARTNLLNANAAAAATKATWAGVTGDGKPEDNATKSFTYVQSTPPTNPGPNDVWVDTSVNPAVTKVRSGSNWVVGATVGATPGNLVIGATVNGILDPNFADPSYWSNLTTATSGSGPGLLGVIRVARQNGDGTVAAAGGDPIITAAPAVSVRGGERVQVGVGVHIGTVVSGSTYAQLKIVSATNVTSYSALPTATNTVNAVTYLTKNVLLPADAVSIQLQLVTSFTAGQAKVGQSNFGKPYIVNLTQIGSNLILADGSTPTEAQLVTSQGTALYLTGQGALATLNTVPASKLTFGSPDNMILDSEFSDTGSGNSAFWTVLPGSSVVTSGAAITALNVRRAITLTVGDGTTTQGATSPVSQSTISRMTVEPGAKYNVASRAYYPVGYSGVTRLNVQFRTGAGAIISGVSVVGTSFTTTAATSPVVEDISAIITAPDTAATIEFRYQSLWGTTIASAGVATVAYPRIQRAVSFGSNLITDSNGNSISDGTALNTWTLAPKVFVGFDDASVPTGWTANQATLSIVTNPGVGSNVLRVTATAPDPNLIFAGPGLLGSTIPRVLVRARPISSNPTMDGLIFWSTGSHGFQSGTGFSAKIKQPLVQNQWDYFAWDMSSYTDWMNNTITGVRFDFASQQQNWEVDWIKFVADVPTGAYIGSTLATQIESATSAATAGLATIANDNILNKGEKPRVIQEWARVQANYVQFTAMATSYGVSTASITSSYNALSTYLNTTIGVGELTNLNTDTPIVGTTLRSRFGDYYAQESVLIGLTSAAAGTTAVWNGVSGAGKPMDGATSNSPGDHMVLNASFAQPIDSAGKIPHWTVEQAYPGTVTRITLATDVYAARLNGSSSLRSNAVPTIGGETLYWRVQYRLLAGRGGTTDPSDTANIWALIRYYDVNGNELLGLDSHVVPNMARSPMGAIQTLTGGTVTPTGARSVRAYFTMDIAPMPSTPSQAAAWCANIDFDRFQWGATYGAQSGSNLYAGDGSTLLNDNAIVTGQGTAQYIQNQQAWATYSAISPTNMAQRTSYLSGTTGRFNSGFAWNTGQMFGARAPVSATITASDRGSGLGAVINVPAHTRYYVGGSVDYNAGSVNVNYTTTYYVYTDDPSTAGGAVTYVASTNPLLTNANINRYFVGSIVTPASGGTSTDGDSGGGGRGGPCVCLDSWMPTGGRAGEVVAGNMIEALDYQTMDSLTLIDVTGVELAPAHCVRIKSASGITLVASIYTPVTFRDGSMAPINQALGQELPVRDAQGFRWERIVNVDDAGERMVAHIHAHGATYGAGEHEGAFIYTHNPAKP